MIHALLVGGVAFLLSLLTLALLASGWKLRH